MVPEPSEEAEGGVQKAVFLTDQQAVVVLNRRGIKKTSTSSLYIYIIYYIIYIVYID